MGLLFFFIIVRLLQQALTKCDLLRIGLKGQARFYTMNVQTGKDGHSLTGGSCQLLSPVRTE